MTKTELVFIPHPGMGHLLSMVELAKLIIQYDEAISIRVLVYHISNFEFSKVQAYVESQSRETDPNRLTLITLPPLSNPPNPSTSSDFFSAVIELQKPLVKKAITDLKRRPSAFLLDLLNLTFSDVAVELNVPFYIYYPAGAASLQAGFHFQSLADEQGMEDMTALAGDPNAEFVVPGFRNRVPIKVLPWLLADKGNARVYREMGRKLREAKGILVNTFMELETYAIQTLHDQDRVPTIYAIGPILALHESSRGGSKKEELDSIMTWLDEQPLCSVVFLCFGSVGCFDADQVKAIANGLDRSGHGFLWSLRKPTQQGIFSLPSEHEMFEDALPEGFLVRTAHRGKIIAWAPQVSVLGHPAIGGFVSHCGWNSILESVWFGIPVATWPLYSEQQFNAFELVKELGISVGISVDYRLDHRTGRGSFMVTTEEVEIALNKLMSMYSETRRKVRETSKKSREVLKDGGSSHYWVTRFVGEVNGYVITNPME